MSNFLEQNIYHLHYTIKKSAAIRMCLESNKMRIRCYGIRQDGILSIMREVKYVLGRPNNGSYSTLGKEVLEGACAVVREREDG